MRLFSCSLLALLLLCLGCVASRPALSPDLPGKTIPVDDSFRAEFPQMVVGDTWVSKAFSRAKGVETYTESIVKVYPDGAFDLEERSEAGFNYQYRYNNKFQIVGMRDLNEEKDMRVSDPAPVRLSFPIYVGKHWKDAYVGPATAGGNKWYENEYTVADFQEIDVAGAKYKAFRIERKHWARFENWVDHETFWYCPAVKNIVKSRPGWRLGKDVLSFSPGGQ
ncbi:hypothetical protein [Salidesulfovibrio onnuriiensis]|uniref:hypothetical protein n=1 Tax=Salidesulfovibrio onnuriiensis TaxID=2583823 RepID=UPI0011CB5BA7|nr:hypothetical protein [Salidesulfovibrio onnuriiensis]